MVLLMNSKLILGGPVEMKETVMEDLIKNVINIAYVYSGKVQALDGALSVEFDEKRNLLGFLNKLEDVNPGYLVKQIKKETRQVLFGLKAA
jgi:hypothetical protein